MTCEAIPVIAKKLILKDRSRFRGCRNTDRQEGKGPRPGSGMTSALLGKRNPSFIRGRRPYGFAGRKGFRPIKGQ
jgi:hypothetical protein